MDARAIRFLKNIARKMLSTNDERKKKKRTNNAHLKRDVFVGIVPHVAPERHLFRR